MQLMSEYEITVVVRPELGGDQIEAVLDRVREVLKTQGGTLLRIEHWGKKKLAYEIAKQSRGIFVQVHFLGIGPLVAELERNLRINDGVMRFLTVRTAINVNVADREIVGYVRPQYEAMEPNIDEGPDFGGDHDHRDRDRDRERDRDRDRDRDRPPTSRRRLDSGEGVSADGDSSAAEVTGAAKQEQ